MKSPNLLDGLQSMKLIATLRKVLITVFVAFLFHSPNLMSVVADVPTTNIVLNLQGTGGYVSIPNRAALQNADGLTIEGWFRPVASPSGATGYYLFKGDGLGPNTDQAYQLYYTPSTGRIGVALFAGNDIWNEVEVPVLEKDWVHIAVTYKSATEELSIYKNGVFGITKVISDGWNVPATGRKVRQCTLPLSLGRSEFGAIGLMDELRIWSTVRTGAEISRNLGQRLSGNESGLTAYYTFDDGTAKDRSTNHVDGTFVSMAQASTIVVTGSDNFFNAFGIHSATAIAQVVNGFVVGATITDGGGGYTSAPKVTVSGGGGSGATAVATIDGSGTVNSIKLLNSGAGYTGVPSIIIDPPPYPPSQAMGTAILVNGFVTGVTISDAGHGYQGVIPPVTFLGGGGSGAKGTAIVINGIVTGIAMTASGAGYTNAPYVLIAAPPALPTSTIEVSQVRVKLSLIPGYTYKIQTSTDGGNSWVDVESSILALDKTLEKTFDVTSNTQLFRVVQVN